MQMIPSTPLYYGKSPAWGDFLKSKGQYDIIQWIDQWIHQALELALLDEKFNQDYLKLPALDFFIGNPQQPIFLIANLLASTDRSGRHFPMVLAQLIEVQSPFDHLFMAPFLYKPIWSDLKHKNQLIRGFHDPDQLQQCLAALPTELGIYTATEFKSFFEEHTLFSFAQLMNMESAQLTQSMIGLGLLLQPVLQHGSANLNKVLILPINNPVHCYDIAAFWVSIISRFLVKHPTEVWVGILHTQSPILLFSFQGADITALSDIFTKTMQGNHWVSLLKVQWIDAYLEQNAGLAALEQSLCERHISLNQSIRLFVQTFIDG